MFQFTKEQLSPSLNIIRDKEFAQFKENWFQNSQVEVSREAFK